MRRERNSRPPQGDVDAFLRALPAMPRAGLEALAARIAFLIEQPPARVAEPDNLVLEALRRLDRHQLIVPPSGVLRKTVKNLNANVTAFQEWARETFKPRGRVAVLSVYEFCLRLLAARLREIRVPVTAATMLTHLRLIPALVARAFPDYGPNGLLPFVAQRMMRKQVAG